MTNSRARAAGPDARLDLRLIASAEPPDLDARSEVRFQAPCQLAEVDARIAVACE